MKYHEYCESKLFMTVVDFNALDKAIQAKYEYYDIHTDHLIEDWNSVSVYDEKILSMIHQYLQVFDFDEKEAVLAFQNANIKAGKVVDDYLDKHLNPKLDSRNASTFPKGMCEDEFTKLMENHCRLLHLHVFHKEYVEKLFLWKLENEIYYCSIED